MTVTGARRSRRRRGQEQKPCRQHATNCEADGTPGRLCRTASRAGIPRRARHALGFMPYDQAKAPSWSASQATRSTSLPRAIAPRSAARSACAPPTVAARRASVTLIPNIEIARLITSVIEVMPFPPGECPDPSATGTPLSSSARTGGRPRESADVAGQSTATTPARASAATSSSPAPPSRSADAQPSSAASVPRRYCPSPPACSRGSNPAGDRR